MATPTILLAAISILCSVCTTMAGNEIVPLYYNVAGDKFGGIFFHNGVQWIPDSYFIGGAENRIAEGRQTVNTDNSELFLWQREGTFTYEIPLENGDYRIDLHFAEFEETAQIGDRIFDVIMEGSTVLASFDVLEATSGVTKSAIKSSFDMTVADNTLSMAFAKSSPTVPMEPILSGIEIQPLFAPTVPTMLPATYEGMYETKVLAIAGMQRYDGKVVFWSSSVPFGHPPPNVHQTYISVFDPDTGTSTQQTVQTEHDMFCPGVSTAEDGRVLISGGRNFDTSSWYDPFTDTWSKGPKLNVARGYHSQATLGDGSVFTMGGSWQSGTNLKFGELWTEENDWQLRSGLRPEGDLVTDDAAVTIRDNFMWFIQAPDGRLLLAGPTRYMHWLDLTGDGSSTLIGTRGDDSDSMCGGAVMYDIGKVLKLGGSPRFNNRSQANNRAYTIDVNGSGDPVVTRVGDMHYARGNVNTVVLPSGEVVVIGGQWRAKGVSDLYSALRCEIWNPQTQQFTLLEGMLRTPRNYHSIALLLRDGRIITAGQNNHFDAEIITPPYLLDSNGDPLPRPSIEAFSSTSEPYRGQETLQLGGQVTVTMDSSESHTFALVRLGSATHATNVEQKRIPLEVASQSGTQFVLDVPGNTNIVPPGSYYLFAMNSAGVPSIAVFFLRDPSDPNKRNYVYPTPAPPTMAPTSVADTATIRISAGAVDEMTDDDGNIWKPEGSYLTTHGNSRTRSTGSSDSSSPRFEMLRTLRDGTGFEYSIPPSIYGEYQVILYFLENWVLVPDTRVRNFHVNIEGTEHNDIDVYAAAGNQKFKEATISQNVMISEANPTVDISFLRGSSTAILMGIEVIPVSLSTPASPTATPPAPTAAPTAPTSPPDQISTSGNVWIRMNVADEDYVDTQGHLWEADKYADPYESRTPYWNGITGKVASDSPGIYNGFRYGHFFAYNIPVPAGRTYKVSLYLTENWERVGVDKTREFDIKIEDKLHEAVDLYALTGNHYIEYVLTDTVTLPATKSVLDVEFTRGTPGNALVFGIMVEFAD